MPRNFTRYAFTDSVRQLQQRHGTREAYARIEGAADRYRLSARERVFIESRDGFYMATVGSNGWPYVQFRGGAAGFLKVIDDTTLAYADFRGNGQYISAGNLADSQRTALILMDYANQQRLKVWAQAEVVDASDDPQRLARVRVDGYAAKTERVIEFSVLAFDWELSTAHHAALYA